MVALFCSPDIAKLKTELLKWREPKRVVHATHFILKTWPFNYIWIHILQDKFCLHGFTFTIFEMFYYGGWLDKLFLTR